ncbi:MAG: adenosylmethionine decarboxylase [Clostridiales bacterium]|jgi:S-adenosylmethionine decarboxylase proenzyme|nr:adenosylmethionine decarboxylase [Clostridiales bacterium]
MSAINNRDAVYQAIKELLVGLKLAGENTDIKNMTLLGAGGVMDSLTAMRFIHAAGERFQINIMDDLNLDCMENVAALADFIVKNQPAAITVGQHIIIDCSRCPAFMFTGEEVIRSLIHALADSIGTEILKEGFHTFSPIGVTGFAIVSASHIVVHTWPEYRYIGADIFSCREIDEGKIIALLKQKMGGGVICERRTMNRGCCETAPEVDSL